MVIEIFSPREFKAKMISKKNVVYNILFDLNLWDLNDLNGLVDLQKIKLGFHDKN